MGISKGNDLVAVTRVSEDFLITGHRRIENDFTDRMARRTYRKTFENRPVC
jgi:hypothetical protein